MYLNQICFLQVSNPFFWGEVVEAGRATATSYNSGGEYTEGQAGQNDV